MATDVERLVVSIEASANKFEKAMNRAVGVTNNSMRSVERRTEQAANRITSAFSRAGTAAKTGIAGIFAGLSIQQVSQFADSFTKVQNSLKTAGLEGENLRRTYQAVYAIAQRQGVPLEAMASLYGRVSTAQKELNATNTEVLRLTEVVGIAMRAQGGDAQQTSSAILQLSQALGSGKVEWEEIGSLMDTARPILQAVAAGMVETGGSVSKLTSLIKDGKVSSEAFFRALLAGTPVIEKMANAAGATMAQNLARSNNALTNLAGKLDEALKASNSASGGVNSFAASIDGIANAVPGAMAALNDLYSRMTEIGNSDVFRELYEGLESMGLGGMKGVTSVNRFDQVFGTKTNAGSMAGYKPGARPAAAAAPAITPIRNSDYAVPGDDEKKKKGRKERINDYEREVQAIGERTRALEVERQTIGLSAGDTAKAEAAFRLLEAAKEANVAVTPQLRAQIDSLATAYGEATQKIEDAEKAQQAVADAAQEVGNMLSDAFTDAIVEGEELDQVLQKLLKSLASKGIDSIFSNLFGGARGSGGGLLDGLFKSLFAPGRATGGSVSAGQPYTVGENGRELFVPTTPGKIVPNGKLGGGNMQVQIFNNAGAQVSTRQTNGPQGPRLEVQIEQMLGGMIADGRLDKSLKGRFGVSPMRGRCWPFLSGPQVSRMSPHPALSPSPSARRLRARWRPEIPAPAARPLSGSAWWSSRSA
jgi:tape measure domain-containing protein